MTAADLRTLLIARLVRAAGGSPSQWRRAIGEIRVYPPATHPHCNWEVLARGTPAEVEAVERMVDRVRDDHPHLRAR